MKSGEGYTKERLSFYRKMVGASASITREKNTIHSFTEVDISRPRKLINEYEHLHEERLSFTGYIVSCLARTLKVHPHFNSFISGGHIIRLSEIGISVLIEREMEGAFIPEPLSIKNAGSKSLLEIHREIRNAQNSQDSRFGSLSGKTWIRLMPSCMMKLFVRLADSSIRMGMEYGKAAVTAVGMFSKEAVWFLPHGSATVLATVGSISKKVIEENGAYESREHLCLTVSFDHDIVDGAPAARFMNDFISEIKTGNAVDELLSAEKEKT